MKESSLFISLIRFLQLKQFSDLYVPSIIFTSFTGAIEKYIKNICSDNPQEFSNISELLNSSVTILENKNYNYLDELLNTINEIFSKQKQKTRQLIPTINQ